MYLSNFKKIIRQSKQKGFTLIELMVVISIIGVLSGILLVSMQNVRASARNARRVSDMNAIIKGIQFYYDKNGQFPAISGDACCDGWDQGPCIAEPSSPFIGALQSSGVMGVLPNDPGGKPAGYADSDCYGYAYYVYPPGTSGCNAAKGSFYVLGIRDMEQNTGTYPSSPGFKCPSRDWQGEFEWVTGGFANDF